jgi:hypothetical protein
MNQMDEMEERLEWLSAEVYQLIYQRVRDMKFPTTATGECVFCGKVGTPDGSGHDVDCLAAEAARASDDDQVSES